jgi:hypothetical protein
VAVALPDQRAERTTKQVGGWGTAVSTFDQSNLTNIYFHSSLSTLCLNYCTLAQSKFHTELPAQIIGVDTYFELFMRLYQLPPSVRHLVLVTTVPLVRCG